MNLTRKNRHVFPLVPSVLAVLVLSRHLLMSQAPPAGTDMLGWVAATDYLADDSRWFYSSWLEYSLGVTGGLSKLPILLAAVNTIIGSGTLVVKALILFLWLLAAVAAYSLVYAFSRNRLGAGIAGLVYTMNPLFIGMIGVGHLNEALAMALGPFLFIFARQLIEVGRK